jgi:hypothetical protein
MMGKLKLSKEPYMSDSLPKSESEVKAFYYTAMVAGTMDNGKPDVRPYYDPGVTQQTSSIPTATGLEVVHKSWQNLQP